MGVEADPQWAEVKRMLEYVGTGHGARTGTLYSDEARLILKAIGKPETLERNKIGFLITDLCDQHLEHDAELGICNTGTVAFKAADQIMAWATGAERLEPDNETLQKLGAFERKCRVGKHQATNWVHLRQTIDALDAAGMTDAADTLIWVVWHEVNGTARAREYHRLALQDVEHKTISLRTEIAAKVGAYREIKMLEEGIREVITICEQDARDQTFNAANTSDKRSKAYAEGRGGACASLATRLRALLSDAD